MGAFGFPEGDLEMGSPDHKSWGNQQVYNWRIWKTNPKFFFFKCVLMVILVSRSSSIQDKPSESVSEPSHPFWGFINYQVPNAHWNTSATSKDIILTQKSRRKKKKKPAGVCFTQKCLSHFSRALATSSFHRSRAKQPPPSSCRRPRDKGESARVIHQNGY